MLKFLFPSLYQNSETVNQKLNKLTSLGLLFTILIFAPFIAWTLKNTAAENQNSTLLFGIIFFPIFYLLKCFSPVILVNIIDSIFYKTSHTMLHTTRSLLPFKLIYIYAEILFTSYIPVGVIDFMLLLLSIWFYINMYISLRNALEYTKIKALIPTLIYVIISNIL